MAKTDWDFGGYAPSNIANKAHASLANPLTEHGTSCLQCFTSGAVFQSFGGHCTSAKTKDLAYGVSTFVEAFMRFENRVDHSCSVAAYLAAPNNNFRSVLGAGYSHCLNRLSGDPGDANKMNLDVICIDPASNAEVHRFAGPTQLSPNVWYRTRLERRVVDVHTLRLVAMYATYPNLTDGDFTTWLDTTIADTDAWFFGGSQPRMGFELSSSYYDSNLYLDGWKGGKL